MPIYKRPEFAELCDVKPAYVTMNIKREKIILSGKLIDTSVPENAEFMRRMLEKKAMRDAESVDTVEVETVPSVEVTQPAPAAIDLPNPVRKAKALNVPEPVRPAGTSEKMAMEAEKLKLTNQKLREEIELKQIDKAKKLGETIPTELVINLFAQYGKSTVNAFKQAADSWITDISQKHKMSVEDMAKHKAGLLKVINKAVQDANRESKKSVQNIVDEHAEKRGRGERKD